MRIMSRCSSMKCGFLATLIFAVTTVTSSQYSSNMFLNGDYQNGLLSRPVDHYSRPSSSAAAFISLISKRASPFVGQQYLPTLLECRGRGEQCVPNDQCENGYFTQKLPKVQNCVPEENVCCVYNAPTPPPTPPPTTAQPFITCPSNKACVAARDCGNGEILSNAVVNLETKKCYEPNVCCGVPSTMLTEDGYVLKTPPSPFTYPQTSPSNPTTPVNKDYLPPQPATPTRRPQPQPQPKPQPTPQQPKPRPPPQPRPQPPQRPQPPPKPQSPAYNEVKPKPQKPTTGNQYLPPVPPKPPAPQPTQPPKPQPTNKPQTPATTRVTQPPRKIPSTSPPRYLPPLEVQPSNQENQIYPQKPIRGEDQLSPQIFPPPKFTENAPASPAKCASALVCTPENFCSSIGVISQTPVEITPFRVPLTDCIIEDSGASGKCCRDPNYVDPWPVNLAGVCASRNKNTKLKGVKDIDANFGEIPWQAMVLKESSKSLLCGGAIIGDGVVLTSASCVQNAAVNDIRVKAGEWELGSTNEPLDFQLVPVKSVAVHPDFDANSGSNDMAVLHLSDRLQFASHIQPICISDKDPTPSENCITTGWGKQALSIHEEGAIMHVTNTKAVSRIDCGADTSGVCSTTSFDACEFDPGSALACGSGSSVLLKGIYSAENACGEGQAVRFIKPDVAWVNGQFLERSKPLLLRV